MPQLDMTAFNYALKRLYTQNRFEEMAYNKARPLLAMMPKATDFEGEYIHVGVKYSHGGAPSANFATAQANANTQKGVKFLIDTVDDYVIARVSNKIIRMSKTNAGSLARAIESEVDSKTNALTNRLARAIYGDRNGKLYTIGTSGVSTVTVTPSSKYDLSGVEVGQVHVAVTGSTVRGAAVVVAVDRDAPSVTYDRSAAGLGWTDADTVHPEGDITSATSYLKVAGLASWIPDSAPGATAFFGVDRTVDKQRLGGCRLSGASGRLDEKIDELVSIIQTEGGNPDTIMMNPYQMRKLRYILGTKVEYSERVTEAGVGFKGIVFMTGMGPVECFADRFCPTSSIYVLEMDSWKLHSAGACPGILTDTTNDRAIPQSSGDGVEIRIGYYAQMYTDAPGHNGVLHTLS